MFFKRMISPADSCISGHANLHLRSLGQCLLKKNMNPKMDFLSEILPFVVPEGELLWGYILENIETIGQTLRHRTGSWIFKPFSFFLITLPLKKKKSHTQFHLPTKRPRKAEKAIKALVSDKLSFTLVIRLETALTYFWKDQWMVEASTKAFHLRKRKAVPPHVLFKKSAHNVP